MELAFGQCLPSTVPPETAIVTDPDGSRPVPISARSAEALDAHALAILAFRQHGIYRDV